MNECCTGELTSEEAATKEATVRSLGNRIWAFFVRGGATQDTSAGGAVPTSADAVEETILFEDPAVVQRDDHRTYPNETHHLFESIKLQPLLQVLNPQQQKYLASLMRREVVAPSACVAEEGGESVLVWCSSGEFDVTQAVSKHAPTRTLLLPRVDYFDIKVWPLALNFFSSASVP